MKTYYEFIYTPEIIIKKKLWRRKTDTFLVEQGFTKGLWMFHH